jgi:hypothetical protein
MFFSQRSLVALVAMMGAFLIPLFSSSLRGLTHVLTCEEPTPSPFTMIVPESGQPQVLSSTVLVRGEDEGLCGGLKVDIRAGASGLEKIKMIVEIQNETNLLWQGTVQLALENRATIPVSIGRVPANESRSDEVEFSVKRGTTQEIEGSLLIGP